MAARQESKQELEARLARDEAGRTREAAPSFDLPAGYQDAGLDAVSVDWRDTPEVTGKVLGFDTLNTENGERRVMLIASGGSSLMVWESAALRRLFGNAQVGDEVYIRTTGEVELPGTRGPGGKPKSMRTFKAAIKHNRPAAGAPARKAPGAGDDIPI